MVIVVASRRDGCAALEIADDTRLGNVT